MNLEMDRPGLGGRKPRGEGLVDKAKLSEERLPIGKATATPRLRWCTRRFGRVAPEAEAVVSIDLVYTRKLTFVNFHPTASEYQNTLKILLIEKLTFFNMNMC